ncbi:MAG: ArsR/SmtB family transcription factor [Promethearchaeota archaeon]
MSSRDSRDESIHLFWLLGNPTRFEILRRLSQEPMFLGQLSRELAVHQQAILRHLQELIERGFLETYEDESIRGPPRKYYRLAKTVRVSVQITPQGIRIVRVVPSMQQPRTIEGVIKRSYPEIHQLVSMVQRLGNIPNELDRKRAAIDLIQQLEAKASEAQDVSKFIDSVVSELQKKYL